LGSRGGPLSRLSKAELTDVLRELGEEPHPPMDQLGDPGEDQDTPGQAGRTGRGSPRPERDVGEGGYAHWILEEESEESHWRFRRLAALPQQGTEGDPTASTRAAVGSAVVAGTAATSSAIHPAAEYVPVEPLPSGTDNGPMTISRQHARPQSGTGRHRLNPTAPRPPTRHGRRRYQTPGPIHHEGGR